MFPTRLAALGLCLLAGLMLQAAPAVADPSARLIHFTEDGKGSGTPLLPGFEMHSIWSAMGQADTGQIYIAVSNHSSEDGNVAIFRLDPATDRIVLVDDLRSVSERAGNWQPGERQYKVHTFLRQHADGLMYFATMPADDPRQDRGAHLYALDPKTDTITDVSASIPRTVTRDLNEVERSDALGGVLFGGRGVKGLGLNPAVPGVLYFMTFDGGLLYRYTMEDGRFEQIGQSRSVAYVFHVDAQGDVYYLGGDNPAKSSLLRYDAASGKTTVLADGFEPNEEIGMIVPTANPDIVMILLAGSKKVFPLHTRTEKVLRGGASCGVNYWRLFNMTGSPDGKHLYFVSNNNPHSLIWRVPMNGGRCEQVLDVRNLLGTRNLAFGAADTWAGASFYTPVWTHEGPGDLAILKVTVE